MEGGEVVAHSAEGALALVAFHQGGLVAFPGAARFQVVVSQHEQREGEGRVLGVAPGAELGLVAAVVG